MCQNTSKYPLGFRKKYTLIFVAINTTTKEVSMTLSYLQLLIQSGVYFFIIFQFLNNVAGDMNIKTCKQSYTMGESHCMFNVLTIGTLYISFAHTYTQGIFTKDFLLVFFCTNKSKTFTC